MTTVEVREQVINGERYVNVADLTYYIDEWSDNLNTVTKMGTVGIGPDYYAAAIETMRVLNSILGAGRKNV